MINEYIRYRVPSARADELVAAYRAAAASLEASPSCLGYELSRCTEDPESFVLKIQWESAAAHLDGFRKSAQFATFFQAVQPFLKEIQEMRHYDITPVAWSRKAGTP